MPKKWITFFIKEIADIYRFYYKLPKKAKNVIFLAEHSGYWPAFEGLITELIARDCDSFCYITSEFSDPALKKSNKKIHVLYINSLLPLFMQFIKCRILIMTLTDLGNFQIKRSVHNVHYIYIFHSMISTHMGYHQGAFDNYDTLFCPGPSQLKEIRAYEKSANLKPKKLVKAGYYRLERIYASYQRYAHNEEDKDHQTILIAPSWGEKNIIERFGLQICSMLLKAKYHVILRPHPQTVANAPKTLKEIELKLGNHKNFKLEKSVASDKSLFIADLMICDLSGVAIEYALGTERPVLFIDIPPKIKNPDYQDLELDVLELSLRKKLGVVIAPEKTHNIVEEVGKLLSQKHIYKKHLAMLRNQVVYNFGSSSKVGAEHIINKLANDSK